MMRSILQVSAKMTHSPFAIIVMLACPISFPSSDAMQVYITSVNSAFTVIVSPCSDRLDQRHVMFATDWSVWQVRVTLSFKHSTVSAPNFGDDVIVILVVAAVQSVLTTNSLC